jgi:hypothetical protein
MGELINARADVNRVEDHVRRTLRAAQARGGEVADAAEARLGPAVAAIDAAVGVFEPAREAEAVAWAAVLAEDAKSDNGIKTMRDAMWNALGRPRQSPFLQQVFPGGVTTYTAGDPTQQPVLMRVLHSRLLAVSAPQWPKQQCEAWANEIEALRQPYAAAIEAHRPTEAAATVAEVGYRSAVRTSHARLRAFKRDLQNLGLTEPQIHEIIPDAALAATPPVAPTPPGPPTPAPSPNGGGAGSPIPPATSGPADH